MIINSLLIPINLYSSMFVIFRISTFYPQKPNVYQPFADLMAIYQKTEESDNRSSVGTFCGHQDNALLSFLRSGKELSLL